MDLASVTERTALVDPAGNRSEQVIEHRTDPLTGTVASLNAVLGEKAKAFLGTADLTLLDGLQESSRKGCPFCTATEKGTRFVPEVSPEAQLRVGRSVAVPNLFSKCQVDAVVIVDPALHVLYPSRLPAPALADAFRAAAEVVRVARRSDAALVHHVAGMNFLQPAGSSVPHPHLQVHVRSVPYSGLGRAQRLAAAWRARSGGSFFDELLEAERGGPRWIGRTGAVEWVAAWAPSRQKEVWGILPGTASLPDASDADLASFADGTARVVSAYEEWGVHAFNLLFHSVPAPGDPGTWALHVKLCARPAFKGLYSNYDSWFTPLFLGDDVHTEAPESYAARLRTRF
jgi:galactose-1-phosphate uridylyltransferase